MVKQFTWISDSCVPACGGPNLIKGKLHNANDYPKSVVEEWAKTGNLMFEDVSKKSKQEKEK